MVNVRLDSETILDALKNFWAWKVKLKKYFERKSLTKHETKGGGDIITDTNFTDRLAEFKLIK